MRVLRNLSFLLVLSVSVIGLTAIPASAAIKVSPTLSFDSNGGTIYYGHGASSVVVSCLQCISMTGTVTLKLNGTVVSTTNWSGFQMGLAFTATTIGVQNFVVSTSGDAGFNPATVSGSITVAKNRDVPYLTYNEYSISNSSNQTVIPGQPVYLRYGPPVTDYGTLPSGTVKLSVDGVVTSQRVLDGTSNDFVASTITALLGAHTYSVSYNGDNFHNGGTYSLVATGVYPSTPATKLAGLQWPGDFSCPPGGTVYPCAPQYDPGEQIDVCADPGLFQLTDNSIMPTGDVKFFLNGTYVGTAPLDEDGEADFVTSISTPGDYSYTFTYDGDNVYQASPGSGLYFLSVVDPNAGVSAVTHIGNSQMAAGHGYRVISANGSTYNSQVTTAVGDASSLKLNRPMVGAATTPDGLGYWQVAGDGGIFSYGDAKFFGSTGSIKLNQPIVGMASTPTGNGYWLVASDGGIFAYGDATFYGSTGSIKLNKPVVGMTPTADGKGYWLVASDGGIFAYGDAKFLGSTGSIKLNKPVVGMTATPSGNGYLFVASDGGIFAYGDASFHGSLGGSGSAAPVVSVLGSDSGNGYTLVAADGGIYNFGDATFWGSKATNNAVAIIGGD